LYLAATSARSGPNDVDRESDIVRSQAEVQSFRSLRQIPAADVQFLHLTARCCGHRDPRANSARIGTRSDKVDLQIVIRGLVVIGKYCWRCPVIGDEYVDLAVAVVVRAQNAAAMIGVI
jgi:hypothetical protein